MKYLLIFLTVGSLFSFESKAQNKTDVFLATLNHINQENRDLVKGQIKIIRLDTIAKTIEIDNSVIPLNNYTVKYLSVFNKEYKRTIQVVMFACLTNGECIVNSTTLDKFQNVGFGFKSKKACLEVINLVKKIAATLNFPFRRGLQSRAPTGASVQPKVGHWC